MAQKKVGDGLGPYIRSWIFGLEDGIISTAGLVLGVSVATHDASLVILAALAAAVPGAISMAAGDYLGSKSQREVQESRVQRLRQNVAHARQRVLRELKQRYLGEGFTSREIAPWLHRLKQNKELLLRKYEEECGCIPELFERPFINAVTMCISFLLGAFVPLFPFLIIPLFSVGGAQLTSFGTAGLSLFVIGAAKTRFTGRSWTKSGVEMLLVGLGAAIVGYGLGLILG